ncbi:MAG TPA: hypothetical protein VFS92_04060, partial [Planctomycetota bacterium]|nr:hypothetical protein [Planctomycetota bacterium]
MSPRTLAFAALVAVSLPGVPAAPAEDPPPAPPAPAPAAPKREAGVLLRNATVLTMAGDPIPEGGVLIREGKIASVGRALPAPDGATVIDCTGRFIVPGFIDAGTQVGLVDIDLVKAANDSDDGGEPSTPDLDVRDGINVESPLFGITRSHGVTTVLVHPQGTNVVNGRGAILHCLDSVSIAEKTVLAPSGLHVSLGGPSKARFAEKDRLPATRMGVAAVLRAEFSKAQEYREKRRRWEEKRAAKKEGEEDPDPPARDPRM